MRRWLLDHLGLLRPFRFERTLLAGTALLLLLATAVLAAILGQAGELKAGTLRAALPRASTVTTGAPLSPG